MKLVRFGIIGTGVGATFAVRALKELEKEKIAKAEAVVSKREERARAFAEKWKIRSWYTDYIRMFKKENIDAAIISTPHYLHFPMAIDAIDEGLNVLIDKPMAINLKECDEIIRRSRQKGVKLGVLLQNRFDEKIARVKKLVSSGKLGRLILGEAIVKWFRTQKYYDESIWRGRWTTEGGGSLINQAIHHIDLLVWIMGDINFLWSLIGTFTHKIEVEDLAIAGIKFKDGAFGLIEGSTSIYPGLPTRLEIHGSKGSIIIEGESIKMIAIEGEEIQSFEKKEGLKSWARPEAVPPTNHISLIRDFANAIVEDREPLVNGEEGRKSIEVIRAIYASGRRGEKIYFPYKEN